MSNIIIQYIKTNILKYISVFVCLIIGIVCGVFFINTADSQKTDAISSNVIYVENVIKQGDFVDKGSLLSKCLKQNIIIILTIWLIGCTIIGIPILYAIVIYKGFCLGYAISAIIATINYRSALIFSGISLIPQNIIIIPIIFLSSVSGINLYTHIMKDKNKQNIKIQIIKHTMICLISLIAMIVAAFVEVYISTNLLIIFKEFL